MLPDLVAFFSTSGKFYKCSIFFIGEDSDMDTTSVKINTDRYEQIIDIRTMIRRKYKETMSIRHFIITAIDHFLKNGNYVDILLKSLKEEK